MLFPLEKLVDFKGNVYEVSCAVARRSYQLSKVKDEEDDDEFGDKIVPYAARQIFDKEVEYLIESN